MVVAALPTGPLEAHGRRVLLPQPLVAPWLRWFRQRGGENLVSPDACQPLFGWLIGQQAAQLPRRVGTPRAEAVVVPAQRLIPGENSRPDRLASKNKGVSA